MINYETQSHARDLIRERLLEAERARLVRKTARRSIGPFLAGPWLTIGLGRSAVHLGHRSRSESAVAGRGVGR